VAETNPEPQAGLEAGSVGDVHQADVPEYYANAVSLDAGFFDLVISFGVTRGTEPGQPVVRVRMTPQHELLMTAFLLNHMARYEAVTGAPIHLPASLTEWYGVTEAVSAIRQFLQTTTRTETTDGD
jgi:hypothetical protein